MTRIGPAWIDELYFNVLLEEPLEVTSGVKIEIKGWMAQSLSASTSVSINLGHPGNSYATFPNLDMGLFTLEGSDSCQKGTCVDYGSYAGLLYLLL